MFVRLLAVNMWWIGQSGGRKMVEIQGRHVLHQINPEDGKCSCGYTHLRTHNGWNVTEDKRFGNLTEIAPTSKGGQPDIYPHWPF